MSTVDLTRFLEVHDDHDRALAELRDGRKRTHWMWYVFPQLTGLGRSEWARRYAIASADEAMAFLTHPVLGPGYMELVDEVWHQVVELGVSVHDLFGSPDDAKLVSSLTLFAEIGRRAGASFAPFVEHAEAVLDAASSQGFERCAVTLASLTADG